MMARRVLMDLLLLLLILVLHYDGICGLTNGQQQLLRHASALSQAAPSNITAAHHACQLWEELLTNEHESSWPPKIELLACTLYAHCLVRVGNDPLAIQILDRALAITNQERSNSPAPSQNELYMTKGLSLQRMMQYDLALKCFQKCLSTDDEALMAAVTCALRLGQPKRALELIEERHDTQQMTVDLRVLRSVLSQLLSSNPPMMPLGQALHDLSLEEESTTSILSRWLQFLYDPEQPWPYQEDPFSTSWITQLAQFNVGPLDDPLLRLLDDKVELHRLLSSGDDSSLSFWPQGYVWPEEAHLFSSSNSQSAHDSTNNDWWIWKRPTGYGSHGNQLVHARDLQRRHETAPEENPPNERKLLQRVIHPTLLIGNQQKFSMRAYVVLLPGQSVYVSRNQGLVKLAAAAYKASNANTTTSSDMEDMFLTNSGRGIEMQQESFDFLKQSMEQQGLSYGELWHSLTKSIQHVLRRYYSYGNILHNNPTNTSSPSEKESILSWHQVLTQHAAWPKILGWDYIVDKQGHPWLLEINRFPGMEPRNEQDRSVKARVLEDTWKLAKAHLHNTSSAMERSLCLEEIVL